ncbi:hypothetical protein NLI96_g551 [Meripilus lineatus]|uniref:Cytochrome P450 n=1 Tax=Meripilus lineatus TaxID=2056292 RepID=A0AAD5VC34_9APHY|nr:hypothetical protein NLI96_g551 [Physisporinus lineatus]
MSLQSYLVPLLALAVVYGVVRLFRRDNVPLPPGPPPDPIIGHLRLMRGPIQETTYYDWHRQYGDVVHLNILGKPIIFLNSEQAAKDLLDKKGKLYSDRPHFPAHELLGWHDILGFMPYGEEFHKTRKLFAEALSQSGVRVFQDNQLNQAHLLLKNFLASPDQFSSHVRRFASAVILEIAYGHRVETDDDPYLQLTEDINQCVAGAGEPGMAAIDFIPLLRYLPAGFPGASVVNHCKQFRPVLQNAIDIPFKDVEQKMASGSAEVSFLSMALENLYRTKNVSEKELRRLKISSFQFYAGGSETTWSTIENFMLIMLLHPDVQKKAQQEIDRVLGEGKLPDFGDRESLPYVECVLQESMRWHPALPLGVPHRVMDDDIYQGMLIPKGATIIANTRCMTMDENVYQNPRLFYPERYLPKPEGLGEPLPGSVFGFGRRICPGRYLAEASVWIVISALLAAFDISPGKDENGNTIEAKADFHVALTSRPKPFKCTILPRSKLSRDALEKL